MGIPATQHAIAGNSKKRMKHSHFSQRYASHMRAQSLG